MNDVSSHREEKLQEETTTSDRLSKTFVSTLVLANLATALPVLISSLLLIEISQSFGIEVGIAGQV